MVIWGAGAFCIFILICYDHVEITYTSIMHRVKDTSGELKATLLHSRQ